MIHKGKPSLGLLIGVPHEDHKPDGEEGDTEASDKACEEVWQAIKDDDYDAFKQAINAWFDARESEPHEEYEKDEGE